MDRNSAYGRSGDNEEEDQSQYRQGKASGYEQDGDRERTTAGSGGYGNRQRPAGEYEDGGDLEESRERSGGGYGRSQKPAGDYEEEEDRDQGYGAKPKSAAKSSAAYGGSGDYEREDEDEDQTRKGKFGFGSTPEKKAGAKHDDYAEEDEYGEKKSFTGAHKPKPSTGELMSSAKIVAGAVRGGEAVDKAKVSGAASTILSGAKQYGGLDEQGLGGYVSKAEDMLQKYGSGGGGGNDFSGKEKKSDEFEESGGHEGRKKPSKKDDGEEEGGSGGGIGGYLKVAQGFMK